MKLTSYAKDHKVMIVFTLILLIILMVFFDRFYELLLKADFSESLILLIYLPGFFILTGLIDAWLPAEYIAKKLGNHSGIKGSVYSFLLGSLMIGPLYLSFPLAIMLLKKGTRRFNIMLFIGAWSVFPIGQEIFEIQFMGIRFFLLRAALSVVFVVIMSIIMDKMKLLSEPKYDY